MHITIIMVVTYILCCFRIATAPWRYWQLNAHYFSKEKGVFSKLQMDELIPDRWRLPQSIDNGLTEPERFPVFLKPEWGQNAHGIHRADNMAELVKLRAQIADQPKRYLMQEAASGKREFELFSIDSDREDARHDVFTVTEAINDREQYPVNSKYNRFTCYSDITSQFSSDQKSKLSAYLSEIGKFGISRMSVRADSTDALVNGDFQVIEINLFLPMPINLLDSTYTWREKWRFILPAMMSLAHATRLIKPVDQPQAIFTRMMMYGRGKKADALKPDSEHSIGTQHPQP